MPNYTRTILNSNPYIHPLHEIPCVILAGGKSSRMGLDKCFLPFKNTSLIDYQYQKFSQIFEKVYISTKDNKFKNDFDLILDHSDIYSPMIALYNIFKTFENTFIFIIAVDLPNIKASHIKQLYNNIYNYDLILPSTKDKIHFMCGFYHSSLYELCYNLLEQNIHKISILKDKAKAMILTFKDNNSFVNLNYYKDYENFILYNQF